ncbi:hypothetical protein GJ744_009301 [Endocarpon pusillum]|uniref:Uncharacterized protein n=1 Tax=Endocarpon pusillum TaxID=364733 RepID=A0A8H7AGB4_9EURO|nr:hypothetical protein GJ744_009301 [Endocarpon pusillum]
MVQSIRSLHSHFDIRADVLSGISTMAKVKNGSHMCAFVGLGFEKRSKITCVPSSEEGASGFRRQPEADSKQLLLFMNTLERISMVRGNCQPKYSHSSNFSWQT